MYSFIVRKRKKKIRCNVKASSQVDWLEKLVKISNAIFVRLR